MQICNSSISPAVVASSQISFQDFQVYGESLYWTESRPAERGRCALIKKTENMPSFDLLPSMSVQSKVHEYGGGSFVAGDDVIVFFEGKLFALYVQEKGENPRLLIQNSSKRFADFSLSPDLSKVLCVLEDHSKNEITNSIVLVDLATGNLTTIHEGHDFYASPRWSFDGKNIGFIFWDFPHMPWEESFLSIGPLDGTKWIKVGSPKESISQFLWIGKDELIFASDRTGFFNLYRWTPNGDVAICKKEADFASNLWVLGKKNFCFFEKEGKKFLAVSFCEKAVDHLGVLDLQSLELSALDVPFTVIRSLGVSSKGFYCIAGSPKLPLSIVFIDSKTSKYEIIAKSSMALDFLGSHISEPKEVSAISSLDGGKIFGFLYPPFNASCKESSVPPLIIKCHSGPTAHSQPLLTPEVQFWTSRGFAYLEVNYRGSSGFGRKYREALDHNWGVLDAQDCLDLALSLSQTNQVDKSAIFARGSSAGGFTVLCMAAISNLLRGCISLYGVTDLETLASQTHKFERDYLESLIGKYEEFGERYKARSPLYRSDQISCPILFLHGDQDCVVPLEQAENLNKKLSCSSLIVFPGEGHGFKKSDTIQKALEEECMFYQKLLNKE